MSAELTAHVPDASFQRALLRFADYKRKSIPEIIKAQARLVCVNLAHNTQPYGKDETAKFKGQNAVRRDLNKVFIGPERLKEIARIGIASGNTISYLLLQAATKGDVDGVALAWQKLTKRSITVAGVPSKGWHQTQRNKRGRVGRGNPMIVLSEGALKAYRLGREKFVGFGKSGWATCARILGGTRGIPGWVSRNRGPGSVKDMTSDGDNPRVILTNSVRYIGIILPPGEVAKALNLQREKMERALQHGLNYEARKLAS